MAISDEYCYIGERYYYQRRDCFGTEIRFFIMDLDGNIDEQTRLIDEYDINGLSFTGNVVLSNT